MSASFGKDTEAATRKYQRANALVPDGVVGMATARAAMTDGWAFLPYQPDAPRPLRAMSEATKDRVFGKFRYEAAPTEDNPEAIRILGDWKKEHIVMVTLDKAHGQTERMPVHKVIAQQLMAAVAEIKRLGLIDRIRDYNGAMVERFVRGSTKTLSNHARGTAIDINKDWNKLGRVPAPIGAEGSVLELVPVFNRHGFAWGGHFDRIDPMHFEVAEVKGAAAG